MGRAQLEEALRNMGREPRKCAEYEQARRDWVLRAPKRNDWPIKQWSVGRMRYELGWLEAQDGQD